MLLAFRVRKLLSMGSFLMERIFQLTPNKVLTAHTEAFSPTCTVHIEDCEGWLLSSCRSSVAEHWRLKPEMSWVRLPVAAGLFHFPLFRLKILLLETPSGSPPFPPNRSLVSDITRSTRSMKLEMRLALPSMHVTKESIIEATSLLLQSSPS